MHYDFENVGGLLQVIAVPPASFVQIRKDYAAGLNYLELRNREDIVSIPVYANDTYSYNEDKEVNDAGDCWNVSVEGVIPKLSSVNHHLMETLERGLWYVLAVDGNGVVHWCGQEDALMLFNTNKTSGRSVSERNGTSFTFTCIQDEPTSYIENMEEISPYGFLCRHTTRFRSNVYLLTAGTRCPWVPFFLRFSLRKNKFYERDSYHIIRND